MTKKKKPYYGKRTRNQVIEAYFSSSASMDEISEIHGILDSKTVANWLKKYGHLGDQNAVNMRSPLPYRIKKSTQKTI